MSESIDNPNITMAELQKAYEDVKFTSIPDFLSDLSDPSVEKLSRSIFEDGKPDRPDDPFWHKYVGTWPEPPQVPQTVFDYAKAVADIAERVSGVEPMHPWPTRRGVYNSPPLGVMEIKESPYVPRGQMWLIGKIGDIHKIINIANYLDENAAISLCIGEMK